MTSFIVETQRLDYTFRSGQPILRQLNLQVPESSIYGFLGPNGAGKTTTLRLLLGLLKNQKGDIKIFGESIATHRIPIMKRIGALIESPSVYLHLTGKENLNCSVSVPAARETASMRPRERWASPMLQARRRALIRSV